MEKQRELPQRDIRRRRIKACGIHESRAERCRIKQHRSENFPGGLRYSCIFSQQVSRRLDDPFHFDARRTDARLIIVGTEIGILHRLRKENPNKRFLPASERAVCPNMKKINLEKILWSLEDLSPEVKVPEEIRFKAKIAVDRMLKIGRAD